VSDSTYVVPIASAKDGGEDGCSAVWLKQSKKAWWQKKKKTGIVGAVQPVVRDRGNVVPLVKGHGGHVMERFVAQLAVEAARTRHARRNSPDLSAVDAGRIACGTRGGRDRGSAAAEGGVSFGAGASPRADVGNRSRSWVEGRTVGVEPCLGAAVASETGAIPVGTPCKIAADVIRRKGPGTSRAGLCSGYMVWR